MSILSLQVDDTGDMVLSDCSNIGFVSGEDACKQDILQAMRMVKGENPFNTDEGVDYFNLVFTPVPDYDQFRDQLVTQIMSVPDTLDVITLNINKSDSTVTIAAEVSTVYGSIIINESV